MKNFILNTMKKLNLNKVPKLMALLVLLFTLGIGNAWAGGHSTHYFQGKAVTVNEGTGSGKVYVQRDVVTDVANVSSGWANEYQTSVLNCNGSDGKGASGNDHMFFCAKPDNASSYFWGWYGEETCAEIMADEPSLHQQILAFPIQGESTEASSPEKYTLYAKFSDQPYPYHYYYGKLKAKSSDGTKGRVQANLTTGDDGYGYWSRSNLAAEHTSPDKFRVKSDEASAAGRIYATAVPMHGYVFTGWTLGEKVAVADGFSADNWHGVFDVTTSTENENSPFVGEVEANFEDASATSVTLLKDANRGTISVKHKYYYLNGSSVSEYSANLDAFTLEEATHTYSTYTKSDVNYQIYPADRMTLTATPEGDYKFYGWYHEVGDRYEFLGDATSIEITLDEHPNYFAYFDVVDADNAFMVGFHQLATWEDALAAAKANAPCNMLLLKDITVPAGYYTIPAGVTLIIPRNADQIVPTPTIERIDGTGGAAPTKFRSLTLENGVTLDVHGTIEVSGSQMSGAQGDKGAGCPRNPYGQLIMKEGSKVILESGSVLRAWGFVTGDIANKDENFNVPHGTIDARRGSTVYEQFQMYDWKGGTNTSMYMGSDKVFPVTQYFIQNIEVPTTYRPGSALWALTSVYVSNKTRGGKVQLIGLHGEDALFLMDEKDDSEDTWVRKSYDTNGDIQLYEINSAAQLSAVYLDVDNYVLPIVNNLHMKVLQGNLDITQNVNLLPGSSIDIAKQAKATILSDMSLYLYDQDEWGTYVFDSKYGSQVLYSPTFGGKPNRRNFSTKTSQSDVAINVHGVMDVKGYLYTTVGGANIFSKNSDAGTILFSNAAPQSAPKVYQWHNRNTYGADCTPARLKNEVEVNGSYYAPTAGTPAGQSYCYQNSKWVMMTVDETNECFVYDNYGTYYAKPGAYVALANGKTENNDHTYSDADGRGRLYILMDECQWWEVENVDNLYKGITRDENDVASWNGKYYEYNTSSGKWEEKRYTITWKDYDGTVITTYRLTYGTTPQYLSTNPTREANLDYTYDFTGWSPAFVPVTGDQIYTATYSETPVRYTITYKNSDGSIISREFLTRGSNPTPPAVTNGDKILQWNPSIGAVTGNQIYTAEWLDNTPTTWTITWKNYDGSTIVTTTPDNEASAEAVAADAPTGMTKPATSEYTYTFAHWEPTIAAATSNATYTAIYTESKKTYTVNFYKEGTTNETKEEEGNLLVSCTGLNMGSTAALPSPLPTKTETGRTYTLQWKDMSTDQIVGVSIPAVAGNTDYVADFSLYTVTRYTISATCATPSSCVITGGGVYDYGTSIDLEAIPNEGYEFVKWSDEVTNNPRNVTVSGSATYTAIVNPIELIVDIDTKKTIALSTTLAGLTISSNGDEQSSEVLGAENLSFVDGRSAYFNLQIGDIESRHWHAFTVPFQVNLKESTGTRAQINGRPLELGRGYDIIYYDGAVRAAQGKVPDCWKYVEDGDSTLYPGKAYMIASGSVAINTVRFTAELTNEGKLILADGLTVSAGEGDNGGWNGIGNPNMYHSVINAGPTVGYVHNGGKIGEDGYVEYNINNLKYVVGRAVYVQVNGSGEQSVVVNRASGQGAITPAAAPARRRIAPKTDKQYLLLDDYYKVSIAGENGVKGGSVYVLDEEEKEDKYVIGHDLAKLGMSSACAQIWVDRYNNKLGLNTTAPIDNQANYPLGIYAPKSGEYLITMPTTIESGKALYLTLDGEAIWNLSDGAYEVTLNKGTTNRYGLRISAKVPQMPTDIDEAVVEAKGETQKVLINNQVYIIRGGEAYTITGKKVN